MWGLSPTNYFPFSSQEKGSGDEVSFTGEGSQAKQLGVKSYFETVFPKMSSDYALGSVECVLIDLDGVVYVGMQVLPGANELFREIKRLGLKYNLITNNSTLTPAQYVNKLATMDIKVPEQAVLTSAVATAIYLRKLEPNGAPVYIIGEDGLNDALTGAGFWVDENAPRYVCVGLDRQLTYQKLATAALAIQNGAKFIASNPDTALPTERGLAPGCGSILAALVATTGVQPKVIGKPQPDMIDIALDLLGARKGTTVLVGDRLDTDIQAGSAAGVSTALVLTGVSRRDEVQDTPYRPDFIVEDLAEFISLLKRR